MKTCNLFENYVFQATQFDNSDRYALATLTISRPGTSLRELQFLQDHYQAGVLENVPLDSVLLTVITNKPKDKRLKYWLSNYTDIFMISINGDIILKKPLDYETLDNYVFYAYATDSFMVCIKIILRNKLLKRKNLILC